MSEATPYEVLKNAAIALCLADGADERVARALFRAYSEHYESDDGPWRLGPDAYYDLLESHNIGHRQLKLWIIEKRAGDSVTPTRRGAALFAKIGAANV